MWQVKHDLGIVITMWAMSNILYVTDLPVDDIIFNYKMIKTLFHMVSLHISIDIISSYFGYGKPYISNFHEKVIGTGEKL